MDEIRWVFFECTPYFLDEDISSRRFRCLATFFITLGYRRKDALYCSRTDLYFSRFFAEASASRIESKKTIFSEKAAGIRPASRWREVAPRPRRAARR